MTESAPANEHTRFSTKSTHDLVWLLDDGVPFAVYCRYQGSLDQFRFSLHEPASDIPLEEMEHYDMVGTLGVRTQFRPASSEIRRPCAPRESWRFFQDGLDLIVHRELGGVGSTLHRYSLRVGEDGRYAIRFQARIQASRQKERELFNLYVAGLEHDHPGFGHSGRCAYTLWRGRDGAMYRHPNSHPFTYLCVPTGRHKHLASSDAGAFLAFGDSPRWNPQWRILRAYPGMAPVTTCDMFFDQHMIVSAPGLEDRDAEGWFVQEMELELYNLTEQEMRRLVEQATDVSRVAVPGAVRKAVAIRLEGVSRLDVLIAPEAISILPMAIFPSWYPDGRGLSHSTSPEGFPALCLDPAVPGPARFQRWEPRPTYPAGRVISLRVRGEALGLDSPAYVGLVVTRCGHDDVVDETRSEPIIGDGPFERSVEIANGAFHFVLPFLQRLGEGGLWILEIELQSRPEHVMPEGHPCVEARAIN